MIDLIEMIAEKYLDTMHDTPETARCSRMRSAALESLLEKEHITKDEHDELENLINLEVAAVEDQRYRDGVTHGIQILVSAFCKAID